MGQGLEQEAGAASRGGEGGEGGPVEGRQEAELVEGPAQLGTGST